MQFKRTNLNGYSGVLYKDARLSIYDFNGHEVLSTGSSTIRTEAELDELLNKMPGLFDVKDSEI